MSWRKHKKPGKPCLFEGCDRASYSRGYCLMHYKRMRKAGKLQLKTFDERFWEKVERRSRNECWEWLSTAGSDGYGHFRVGSRMRQATHVSWYLATGEWPRRGLFVCHKCDNPACVNPSHLFLGTPADNSRDAQRKGRVKGHSMPGERHPNARLTTKQVRRIRALLSTNITQRAIAQKFDVTEGHISDIAVGRRWKGVEPTELDYRLAREAAALHRAELLAKAPLDTD